MNRQNHVSLRPPTSSSGQQRPLEKKLRKRRELDAMVSHMPGKIGQGRQGNNNRTSTAKKSGHSRQLLGHSYSNTSENDDEDDDDEDDDDDDVVNMNGKQSNSNSSSVGAYIKFPYSLVGGVKRRGHGPSVGWLRGKNKKRLCRLCHSACLGLVVVAGFFAVLTVLWLQVSMRAQSEDLRQQLATVIEERKSIADNHQLFTNQIGQISSNQSALKDNLTNLHGQVEMLASQVQQLNSSVTAVLKSLEAAPQLKSLPSEVLEVQKDVAQFGSRLADIESQLGKTDAELKAINKKQSETPQISRVTPPQQIKSREAETAIEERLANATARLDNKIDGIDTKLKSFGAEITEKVQKQEVRAKKSWQIIGDLQDNIHNVSAKASSNDVLCRANQREISNLQTKVSNLSTSSSSSSSKEQGV